MLQTPQTLEDSVAGECRNLGLGRAEVEMALFSNQLGKVAFDFRWWDF
jgi:hypothetical protein